MNDAVVFRPVDTGASAGTNIFAHTITELLFCALDRLRQTLLLLVLVVEVISIQLTVNEQLDSVVQLMFRLL